MEHFGDFWSKVGLGIESHMLGAKGMDEIEDLKRLGFLINEGFLVNKGFLVNEGFLIEDGFLEE